MKAVLLATALALGGLAGAFVAPGVAQAREQVLPPTDETAAAAARAALSGKTWTGKLTVDNQTFDTTLTLNESGRGAMKVSAPTGEAEEMTLLWGVLMAAPGGNASLVLARVKPETTSNGASELETDDDLMEFDGKVEGTTFSGTLKFEEGTSPFSFTAQ